VNPSVLFIHGIAEIGGAERELLAVLEHLPESGYCSMVVTVEEGPLIQQLHALGIDTRHAPMPPWRKFFAYSQRGAAVRRLREVILAAKPAVLHVNDIWWMPQVLRAAEGTGIPVVGHVRQEIQPWKVHRYGLHQADLVFAVSRGIHDALAAGGVLKERIRTLYSGLDLRRVPDLDDGVETRHRLGIPGDAPLLGTVANLFPRKGYEVILGALPAILRSFPNLHYVIVGGGEPAYERTLQGVVSRLGLENRVHFMGFQNIVYPYLAALNLYVHPALMEGFGIAVLEAMAMRKPVVATTAGGLQEIVRHHETGLLVPPGDHEALASAVSSLLANPALAQTMGESGRLRVTECFSLQIFMRGLVAEYRMLVGKSTPLKAQALA